MARELVTVDLDAFFNQLRELVTHYIHWTEEVPKKLVINPEIVGRLARVTGFYQRPELRSEVTTYAPIVRYFKIGETVLTLQEDYEEKFLHLE